jgi:hypothetical protein
MRGMKNLRCGWFYNSLRTIPDTLSSLRLNRTAMSADHQSHKKETQMNTYFKKATRNRPAGIVCPVSQLRVRPGD